MGGDVETDPIIQISSWESAPLSRLHADPRKLLQAARYHSLCLEYSQVWSLNSDGTITDVTDQTRQESRLQVKELERITPDLIHYITAMG